MYKEVEGYQYYFGHSTAYYPVEERLMKVNDEYVSVPLKSIVDNVFVIKRPMLPLLSPIFKCEYGVFRASYDGAEPVDDSCAYNIHLTDEIDDQNLYGADDPEHVLRVDPLYLLKVLGLNTSHDRYYRSRFCSEPTEIDERCGPLTLEVDKMLPRGIDDLRLLNIALCLCCTFMSSYLNQKLPVYVTLNTAIERMSRFRTVRVAYEQGEPLYFYSAQLIGDLSEAVFIGFGICGFRDKMECEEIAVSEHYYCNETRGIIIYDAVLCIAIGFGEYAAMVDRYQLPICAALASGRLQIPVTHRYAYDENSKDDVLLPFNVNHFPLYYEIAQILRTVDANVIHNHRYFEI